MRIARELVLLVWLLQGGCSAAGDATGAVGTAAGTGGTTEGPGGQGGSAAVDGSGDCQECVAEADCSGQSCAQFGGGTYCAPRCTGDADCAQGSGCVPVSDFSGQQVQVCVPSTDACGADVGASGAGHGGAAGTAGAAQGPGGASAGGAGGGGKASGGTAGLSGGSGHGGQAGGPSACSSLVPPDATSCCHSCAAGQACQANGCYGGWWCNTASCSCQKAPAPSVCGGGSAGSAGATGGVAGASGSGGLGGFTGSVGPDGGTLDRLGFAIVGDTRPPSKDDLKGYPTAIITSIWQRVQASGAPFAIGTGDYQFSSTKGSQAAQQLDLYLGARAAFGGVLFAALGNHECTGATNSNCGSGNADGVTANYQAFTDRLLTPIGKTTPYYTVRLEGTAGDWTAKVVVVAANAWSSTQAAWLEAELSKPTTYTFVVRHEASYASTAPGVKPSDAIVAKHPSTLLIAGHTHTYQHLASSRTLVVGNGGAPLTGSVNYGYVLAQQRADGAMVFTSHDYATDAVADQFAVKPDGSAAP